MTVNSRDQPISTLECARRVRDLIERSQLVIPTEMASTAISTRQSLLSELDDHIIARLSDMDAPAIVVVGGSTGAGKSTVVNSLLGRSVTRSGVLRPTTSAPVLVCSPQCARWFDEHSVLASFARRIVEPGQLGGGDHSGASLDVVITDAVPDAVAVIDAPDIDSVVQQNRELASQLMAAADIWLFVTTAARYGDAIPWDFLTRAAQRSTSMAIVLNRVPSGAASQIEPHLRELLAAHGLGSVPVFVIDEQPLSDGQLGHAAVAQLRGWLDHISTDSNARAAMVRATLDGALRDSANNVQVVADALDRQDEVTSLLSQLAIGQYSKARRDVAAKVASGALLRGEVMSRWQDLVGTGELLRQLQSSLGRMRDKVSAAITGKPLASTEFRGAVESGIETLVVAHAQRSAKAVAESWAATDAGSSLLSGCSDRLDRESADCAQRTARTIRDWQGSILDMLRVEGQQKTTTAKALSYGVNGVAAVLMLAVFAQTGGLTGAELAIAGGSSAVGQRLVEALLGDQVIRDLAKRATADLDERVGQLFDAEAARYLALLVEARNVDSGRADELRRLATQLVEAP